jgi:7-carboxy-7-deazaguanine synthase
MIRVVEIFTSLQGESTRSGLPCTFIRLSGCNLACSYCDTVFARHEGVGQSIEAILDQVDAYPCRLVEITGGEPLLQKETPLLCRALGDHGYTVLVETNGSQDISVLPEGIIRIVDIKCPGSGHADSFYEKNFAQLTADDEVKFVITDRADFDWAMTFIRAHDLHTKHTVLVSPVTAKLAPAILADWILQTGLPIRLNLQLHTILWGENVRKR